MKRLLLGIALGTALGASLRYGVDQAVVLLGLATLPLGTLLVNLSGSGLIGWLAGRWSGGGDEIRAEPVRWHFWVTGICGGYTTFSSFAWEVLSMLQAGEGQAAGIYAAASVGLGLLAVWLGLSLGVAGARGRAAP